MLGSNSLEMGIVVYTIKQHIQAVIDALPETVTIEEAIEELRVLDAVLQGLADVEAGHLIPHEQVVAEFRSRL